MTAPPRYAPRPCRSLGTWRVGEMALKAYHIGASDPTGPRRDAATEEARRITRAADDEGASSGLGFLILHEGEMGAWLLLDWWAHGDILCQRLSLDAGTGFAPVDDRPLAACVWELPIIAHERDAWVRHMMDGTPDAQAYLADFRPGATV